MCGTTPILDLNLQFDSSTFVQLYYSYDAITKTKSVHKVQTTTKTSVVVATTLAQFAIMIHTHTHTHTHTTYQPCQPTSISSHSW